MSPLKFVKPLSEDIKQQLDNIYQSHQSFRVRQRAHAILLSNQGYTINQIQDILRADRDSISVWINRFNERGIEGLKDFPHTGRRPIYTEEEVKFLKMKIDEEPRQIKQAQALLEEKTGKKSGTPTIARILKKTVIRGDVVENQ